MIKTGECPQPDFIKTFEHINCESDSECWGQAKCCPSTSVTTCVRKSNHFQDNIIILQIKNDVSKDHVVKLLANVLQITKLTISLALKDAKCALASKRP